MPKPTAKATAAALMPMRKVSRPDRHQSHRGPSALNGADAEEGRASRENARDYSAGRKVSNKRHETAHNECGKGAQCGEDRRSLRRRKTVFLHRHCLCPQRAVGGNHRDDPLEILAREALGGENLPDFFTFAVRREGDMSLFDAKDAIVVITLGLGADIVRCRHGKAIG